MYIASIFLAKMISTKMLMNLLHKCGVPSDESLTTILIHLKEIAVLVRGNWVIKSEVIYPDNTISSHFGLNFEVMRILRDYTVRYFINIIFIRLCISYKLLQYIIFNMQKTN